MKIYVGQDLILQQVDKKGKKSAPIENDFQKIIDQIVSRPEKGEKAPALENVPVMNGISIAQTEPVTGQADFINKEKLVGTLEETLDIIDFYAGKLADSTMSAEGLTPLINHLEERLGILEKMESAPEIPEKLRPVISDMSVTIGTEIARFRRGDYL